MKTEPKRANFDRIVVEPIENGYIVIISTEIDEKTHAFSSYRQVLRHLKGANDDVDDEGEI